MTARRRGAHRRPKHLLTPNSLKSGNAEVLVAPFAISGCLSDASAGFVSAQ